ncbi:AbrB/MazE/SpoVT family DNA-binding domain-containing protein [Sphingomonas sp. MMS24-JH45]
MTYHAKVIAGGKIVIPADLRREFEIKDGDSVVLERAEDGTISLKTFSRSFARSRPRFRKVVGAGLYRSINSFVRTALIGVRRVERRRRIRAPLPVAWRTRCRNRRGGDPGCPHLAP